MDEKKPYTAEDIALAMRTARIQAGLGQTELVRRLDPKGKRKGLRTQLVSCETDGSGLPLNMVEAFAIALGHASVEAMVEYTQAHPLREVDAKAFGRAVMSLRQDGVHSTEEVAKILGMGRKTLWNVEMGGDTTLLLKYKLALKMGFKEPQDVIDAAVGLPDPEPGKVVRRVVLEEKKVEPRKSRYVKAPPKKASQNTVSAEAAAPLQMGARSWLSGLEASRAPGEDDELPGQQR